LSRPKRGIVYLGWKPNAANLGHLFTGEKSTLTEISSRRGRRRYQETRAEGCHKKKTKRVAANSVVIKEREKDLREHGPNNTQKSSAVLPSRKDDPNTILRSRERGKENPAVLFTEKSDPCDDVRATTEKEKTGRPCPSVETAFTRS